MKQVHPGDIYMVIAADLDRNSAYTVGNYFSATQSFLCSGDPVTYYPAGNMSTDNWTWVGHQFTKGNPGIWKRGQQVNQGDTYLVTPADHSRNSAYTPGNYFVAAGSFICNEGVTDYPSGDSSGGYWTWVGNQQSPMTYPLNRAGNPGVCPFLQVNPHDIYIVTAADHSRNSDYTAGNYFLSRYYQPPDLYHPYPSYPADDSSTDSWAWIGNQQYPLNTKGNPGLWWETQQVNAGDIYMVDTIYADVHSTTTGCTAGNYFLAADSFVCKYYAADMYPAGDSSTNHWLWVGNKQYPLNTKGNPGIWKQLQQVHPGDIYMVTLADHARNSAYTTENYFVATGTFVCNEGVTNYPAGDSSTGFYWSWIGNHHYPLNTKGNPGTWKIGQLVNKGDIYMVTADHARNSAYTSGNYFVAAGSFICNEGVTDYPSGDSSGGYWTWVGNQQSPMTYPLNRAGNPGVCPFLQVNPHDIYIVTAADHSRNSDYTAGNYFLSRYYQPPDLYHPYPSYPADDSSTDSWAWIGNQQYPLNTKGNPGLWWETQQVNAGDIYMVDTIYADVHSTTTGCTAGNYFLAADSFVCKYYAADMYPAGDSSTNHWLWVGNKQYPLNTKGNPGIWKQLQQVHPGDIYMVTLADHARNSAYTTENYFVATGTFVCNEGVTNYPAGDSSTGFYWSWIGNHHYPLNTKGNPGTWKIGQLVNKGDIYMVTADHARNSAYTSGNYFVAAGSFSCNEGVTNYPVGDSSGDYWTWVGNQQYPPNTKGNPGIWKQGQQVHPGDIYMVTLADHARNSAYTTENYFVATGTFVCNEGVTNYPAGDSSTGFYWSWIGNHHYPLNTKGNPGTWKIGQLVNKGDIYMVTADHARNSAYTSGNYFVAAGSFSCNEGVTNYPVGDSSGDYWTWVGNQQYPPNTKGNPGIWKQGQQVHPGDIYMVTLADHARNSAYTTENYFVATGTFVCNEGVTNYPAGDSSTGFYWSWIGNHHYPLNTKGNPGTWKIGQLVNKGDIYMVTADHARNSAYTSGNYFVAAGSFSCNEGVTNYPVGDSSGDYWTWVGNQQYPPNTKGNPGIWKQGQQVHPGDIYMVTLADHARNSAYTTENYFVATGTFVCNEGVTNYPAGDSSTGFYWSWIGNHHYPLNTKGNPGTWKIGQLVNKGDIYMVTADHARNSAYTSGNYFVAAGSFSCNEGVTNYPVGDSSGDYWTWVGNQQYPPNTKGNPGIWKQGQQVHPGDIYMVTLADHANNPSCTTGNYFSAIQSFVCSGKNVTYYPAGNKSTDNWAWVFGNQQYPLSTKGNPGIWASGLKVNPGDIYMVTAADHANNPRHTTGNYFSATQSFVCHDGTTAYPAGDSSTRNWMWVGNQQNPLNTKRNPGIWKMGQQVNPGDIYMVTIADHVNNSHYTTGNYFSAIQSFVCSGKNVTYYPVGNTSTDNWTWVGNQQDPL
ncbi:hypothetical protein [Pseudomonas fluorescens]|nr:hypothetical protein [Pseudomonas fluorescens]